VGCRSERSPRSEDSRESGRESPRVGREDAFADQVSERTPRSRRLERPWISNCRPGCTRVWHGSTVIARERPPCAGPRPYGRGRLGRNSGPNTSASCLRCRPAMCVSRQLRFWPVHRAQAGRSSQTRTREPYAWRLDAASCQRGLDRLLVTSQMIKRPGLVGEPGGGPGSRGLRRNPVSIASRAALWRPSRLNPIPR